jgi:RHS repeat-associated protein
LGDGARQKFTQKERDNETGLDFFEARYYASTQGRFTSPDSYFGLAVNPQTLNLYSYVHNNPLKYIDPTGHQEEPQKKRGKKGENDPEICDDCVVIVNSVPANSPPPPTPQPAPMPTPASPSTSWFMTREELQAERRVYYQSGQANGVAYDIAHNPVLLFMMGLSVRVPEEPITADVLDDTGVILDESLAVETNSSVGQTRPAATVEDIVMPGGAPIGEAGTSVKYRVLQGQGLNEAQAMFDKLRVGGSQLTRPKYQGTLVRLPDGGTVGLRTKMTRSPGTAATIDVNVHGIPVTKIKFNP